jgi:hypothetical protein
MAKKVFCKSLLNKSTSTDLINSILNQMQWYIYLQYNYVIRLNKKSPLQEYKKEVDFTQEL